MIKNLFFIFAIYTFFALSFFAATSDLVAKAGLGDSFFIGVYAFSIVSCVLALVIVKKYPKMRIWADILQFLGGIVYFPVGLLTIVFYRRIVMQFKIKPSDNNIIAGQWLQDVMLFASVGCVFAFILIYEKNISLFPIALICLMQMKPYYFTFKDGKLFLSGYNDEKIVDPNEVKVFKITKDNVTFKLNKQLFRLSLKFMGFSAKDREKLIPYFQNIKATT
jgi:hypothetical protein